MAQSFESSCSPLSVALSPLTTDQPLSLPAIPFRELLPWLLFGGLMMLLALYFVGAEQGATSLIQGSTVHEFLHDGRHLLGFPCH